MDSLPAIDSALLPADVRSGDASQRKQYASALAFEQMLLQRMLSSAMPSGGGATDAATDDEDGTSSGDAVSHHYAQMLPELMAQAVTQGGGLGLARQLYDAMQGPGASASTSAGSGGAAAPASGDAA